MDDLVRYLEANRDRYTREALTQRLIDAGHPAVEVDAAWARLQIEEAPRPGLEDRRNQAAWIVAVAYVGTWAVFSVGWLFPRPGGYGDTGYLLIAIFAATLFIPGLIGILSARRSRQLRNANALGVIGALIVPFVFLVGLTGVCVRLAPPFAEF